MVFSTFGRIRSPSLHLDVFQTYLFFVWTYVLFWIFVPVIESKRSALFFRTSMAGGYFPPHLLTEKLMESLGLSYLSYQFRGLWLFDTFCLVFNNAPFVLVFFRCIWQYGQHSSYSNKAEITITSVVNPTFPKGPHADRKVWETIRENDKMRVGRNSATSSTIKIVSDEITAEFFSWESALRAWRVDGAVSNAT